MNKFKLVYQDRGSYADDDKQKGYWRIYEKKWWGWKQLDITCWGLQSAKDTVERIKNNPVVYL